MPLWQYQQKAEPLLPILTVDNWLPVFPDIVSRRRGSVQEGLSVLPPLKKIYVDSWLPTYPDRLYDKRRVISFNLSLVSLVTPPPPSLTIVSWIAQYPNIINRRINRVALHTAASSFVSLVVVIPVIPIPPPEDLNYYRRYLNDTITPAATGPSTTESTGTETSLTNYLRRYLNDTTN